ncbi:peptide amidase [Halalkalicoccus jeotgali B3]|nr:peptide amidase [Halalkalicoccus jeotgali B3]
MQGIGLAGLGGIASMTTAGATETDSAKSFDPIEATVQDVRTAITSGQVTTRSIVQHYLDRIEVYDEALNALITVNPQALDRADELDKALEESGPVGPLHGVPIIVKDNYDATDMPTTAGAIALKDSVPPDDAFLVKQLREAGGIILAKGNLDEFAGGPDGWSSLGGQTPNPYALDRVPGGSSAGPGAAIAANFAVIGIGTETSGSLVNPAAYGSLVGIRPTRGLLSRDGIVPVDLSQDTGGPLTRTVSDAAVALDVMRGYDPDDPITARGVNEPPLDDESYTDFLNEDGLENVRIGVVREFFGAAENAGDEPGITQEQAEADAAQVTEVIDCAIEDMEQHGAEIVDPVSLLPLDDLLDAASAPSSYKLYLNEYLESLGDDAPYRSVEELAASNLYGCPDAASLREAAEAEPEPDLRESEEYLRAIGGKVALRDAVEQTMVANDVDVLLYPTRARTPPEIGKDMERIRLNYPVGPTAGLPSISVPAGFTEDEYLPVGLELLGLEFAEPLLIETAYAYEQATLRRQAPDGFGPLPADAPDVPYPDFSYEIATEGCSDSS